MLVAILITLSGIVTIVMAVYGGILTSADPRHRRWFIGLGIVGVLFLCAQGYYLYQTDKSNASEIQQLKEQGTILLNTIKLQATLDDVKGIETSIDNGFSRLEAVIKGQKIPPKIEARKAPFPPPVVEHMRYVQRRTASTRDDAPYGIQAIMQTDNTIQPVAFRVDCDQEITEGGFFIVGEGGYTSVATSYSQDRKAFLFSFHSPAFTPDSSLVVTILSKKDIRITGIHPIQPMF